MQAYYAEQNIHIASLIVADDGELDIIPLDEEDRWEEVEYTEPVSFCAAAQIEFRELLQKGRPGDVLVVNDTESKASEQASADHDGTPSVVNDLEASFERLKILMHGLSEVR